MHSVTGGTGSLKVYMASGGFHKPEVVLDNVARSQPTDDGVIDIKTRDLTGRIGISKNAVITGGVVDGTGETGITAVCKLLLLPYGEYTFRRAIPVDKLHLEQDLNLRFNEAKTFLSGPSSIGMSSPSEHVLSNLRPSQTTDDFGWESTSLRNSYESLTPASDTTSETYEGSPENIESYGSAPQSISGSYLHDCNKLIEAIDRKRADEIHVLNQPRKAYTDLETLNKPGPLPYRKSDDLKINVAWAFMAVLMLFGLIGFSMICKPVSLTSIANEPRENSAAPAQAPSQVAQASAPKPSASGTAPFALPSGSSTSSPPPNPTPAAPAATQQSSTNDLDAIKMPQTAVSTDNNMAVAPAATSAGSPEVTRWMDAVQEPGNATARRKLAYAYLVVGNSPSSIEQFYSLMKLEKVDSSEISEYADNMMVFCGRGSARQFLADVLRSDPGQTAVRQKLASM